ncbi:MAG: endonuclease/exonuclease/phosphatase family protein [Treponema sp.]|nr:endonuclease/exonuclease/phosphatase family protein [Treponema sp.]
MKKQLRFVLTVPFLAIALLVGACSVSVGERADFGSFTIMTWNVHNLFDGEDNGYEYTEFLQSSGWSVEKYLGRINTISDAISSIVPLPDIIVFQEVENLNVLEDLALAIHSDFLWIHFAGNPGSAIGLGLISRHPLLDVKAHSITINGDTSPRPILEARIQPEDSEETFVIFTCHWKSKLGGDVATESTRRASARVILRRIHELWEDEPELGIIVAGDLNINYDDFYRHGASIVCALLPDDPYCVILTAGVQKDFIVITRNIPPMPVHFSQETIVMYSPWMGELEKGTYYYRNNWETIDHFLVSYQFFNNSGWVYEKTVILDIPPFANANGMPIPYNVRTGFGISDHLPLLMTLNYK